ncbi:MAG: PaaI family thioesterase [Peptoniphilaceae bacterium]|nr:PaaI family thioesterase [Peptoniphilaceae bacterium]MDY6018597.1 PaaI family thioesterase [Anaerococcus sp.]
MKDFDDLAGVELLKIENKEGFARVRLKDESLNAIGTVHGGLLMTLADTVAGNLISNVSGRIATTAQASINYLNPCFGSEYIYAKASVIKEGKNLSTIYTEITDDSNKLIATATFVFFHLNKEIKLRKDK